MIPLLGVMFPGTGGSNVITWLITYVPSVDHLAIVSNGTSRLCVVRKLCFRSQVQPAL